MKVMKKTLAVLLVALMMMSLNAGVIFADGETAVPNGDAVTVQISNTTAPAHLINSTGSAEWKDFTSINGTLALFRIDIPNLGNNQAFRKFEFKFVTAHGSGYMSPVAYIIPVVNDETTLTLADVSPYMTEAYKLTNVDETNSNSFSWPNKTTTVDITDAVVNASSAGVKSVYVGVTASNSTVIFGTQLSSSNANLGVYPKYTYSVKYADDNAAFDNGVEMSYTLSNSTDPSYYVTASGSTTWQSRKSINGVLGVFRIPLPQISKYQTISDFKFKYVTTHGQGYMSPVAYALPGSWDLPSMKLADVSLTNENKLTEVSTETRTGVYSWSLRDTTVDITKAAIEAYENNQKYVYVGVTASNSTELFGTWVYSSETGLGLYPGYSFTLGEYNESVESDTFTNGTAYYITAGNDPEVFAMVQKNSRYSLNSFVLFTLPVPSVEKGYDISSYKLDAYVGRNDAMFALKFPGENWNLAEGGMRFGDENVSAIISDWYANKGESQYNAADAVSYANNRMTLDIATYMNECVKKGQKKCYVAVIGEWTSGVYGFRTGNAASTNMNYTLKYACDALGVKIADADAEGANYDSIENVTSLESGASYKAVGGFINKSLTDGKATLIIAKYNDADKLLGVEYAKDVVMSARNANGYIESEDVTVDGECSVIKAFIWENGEIVPLCESAVAELN